MNIRIAAVVVVILIVAAIAYASLRSDRGASPGQPSPHALDQSQ